MIKALSNLFLDCCNGVDHLASTKIEKDKFSPKTENNVRQTNPMKRNVLKAIAL
jgi:hypothetical protein